MDAQTIGVLVAAVSVVIGVAYNSYSIHNSNKTRQAQIYMGIWAKMNSAEASEAWMEWENAKVDNIGDWNNLMKDRKMNASWFMWISIFEGVAVFVREGLVDIRLVARDMGNTFVFWWRRYEQIFKQLRIEQNYPRYMIEAEWLYDRMIEFGKQHPEFHIT